MKINIEKCTDKDKFIELIDDAIQSLLLIKQSLEEEEYDELQ